MGLDRQLLTDIVHEPGVYLFLNAYDRVLYVGKAKNLRKRLTQYFNPQGDGRVQIPHLMQEAHYIKTIIVRNELEALLLESNLIKLHQPKFNVMLRSDLSMACLHLNTQHSWPRLHLVRARTAHEEKGVVYGPYLSSAVAREMMDIIYDLYPLRRCSDEELVRRNRPCLWYHMKKCSAPCMIKRGEWKSTRYARVSVEEFSWQYQKMIEEIDLILRGKGQNLQLYLDQRIKKASDDLEFERAREYYNLKQQVKKIFQAQNVDCPTNKIDADVIAWSEENFCILRLKVREGQVVDTRIYEMKDEEASKLVEDKIELFVHLILQIYREEDCESSEFKELVIPLPEKARTLLQDALSKQLERKIKVYGGGQKDRGQWLDLALRNLLAMLGQKKQDISNAKQEDLSILQGLKKSLDLSNIPLRIECFDISHLGGRETVGSCAVYDRAERDRDATRRYKLRDYNGDDPAAMRELLQRRVETLKKSELWPNLWLIDGGAYHVNLAQECLDALNIVGVDLLSISKEKGKHTKGQSKELIHGPRGKLFVLEEDDPTLLFLQRIRDDSHQVAISYLRHRRAQQIRRSSLDQIPGIGPKKKKKLLEHFGSVAAIKRSNAEEISQLKGLSYKDCQSIIAHFGIDLKRR